MKNIYIKTAVKRKLIDIKPAVFDSLMVQAKGEGLSLKKYIEALLERESQKSGHGIPHYVKDARYQPGRHWQAGCRRTGSQ